MYRAWLSAESIRFRLRALKARFRDQRAELNFIKQHVRPNNIVCDIGANKGSFIYWLSRWCRDGKVIAFEPQPDLADYLHGICSKLALQNVWVEQKAVYSLSGTQELFVPADHQPGASLLKPSGASLAIGVPTVSLDEYFSEGDLVTVLKIDVEGAELHVLKGAERILRESAPTLILECERRHLSPGITMNDVFSFLNSLGYEGSFVHGGDILPLERFNPNIHQRAEGEYFWKNKGYCNNFIFQHPRSVR